MTDYQFRCAYSDPMVPFRVFRLFAFGIGVSTIKKVETNCRLCKNPLKFIVLFTELTHERE